MDLPVIVAFVDAYMIDTPDLSNLAWWSWGHAGSTLKGGQAADTSAEFLTMGADGHIYFVGDVAGGNSIFNHDPRSPVALEEDEGEMVERFQEDHPTVRIGNDLWSTGSSGPTHITFIARLTGGTGTLERSTQINTVRREGGLGPCWPNAVAADRWSRTYIALGCRWQSQGRDAVRVNGVWPGDTGNGNEVYLAVLAPDFTSRYHWAPLTMPGEDVDDDGVIET